MTETAVRMGVDEPADAQARDEEPIDEELVEEAARGLGTEGRNATINAAVRDYVERKRASRRAALERVQRMADEGLLDFDAVERLDR
jgi:Arc/MetJ family transcription regulator